MFSTSMHDCKHTLHPRQQGAILYDDERQQLESAGVRYVSPAVRHEAMSDD